MTADYSQDIKGNLNKKRAINRRNVTKRLHLPTFFQICIYVYVCMYDVHKYLHNYSPTQLNLLVSERRHVSSFLERHLQVFYWTNSVLECMYVLQHQIRWV
jgi:hypothetical protein